MLMAPLGNWRLLVLAAHLNGHSGRPRTGGDYNAGVSGTAAYMFLIALTLNVLNGTDGRVASKPEALDCQRIFRIPTWFLIGDDHEKIGDSRWLLETLEMQSGILKS